MGSPEAIEDIISSWLPHRKVKDDAVLRLFAFHWFGASASAYGTWDWRLSDDVELCAVQLPGRENRKGQSLLGSVKDAAEQIVRELRPLFEEKRCALFGHSSGAWLAYEVALELRRQGLEAPVLLFVSNFAAPQTNANLRPWRRARELSEDELKKELLAWGLGATVTEPGVWPHFKDLLRTELASFDEYTAEPDEEPLACPIAAFISQDDPKVGPRGGNPELMEAWGALSSHMHMTVDVFFGNHFYLQDSKIQKAVAKAVAERTAKVADLLSFDF